MSTKKHSRRFTIWRDIVTLGGILAIIYGLYAMWSPLGWMAGGLWMLVCAAASYWMEPKNDNREG